MNEKSVTGFSNYAAKSIIYLHVTDVAIVEIAPLLLLFKK